VTAFHWRRVRLDLALAGIADPMSLPTMHTLLDIVERLILESMQSAKPKEDEAKRENFLNRLYMPDPAEMADIAEDAKRAKGSGHKPAPFTEEETEAAFDWSAATMG
jgi:hypothetical protein